MTSTLQCVTSISRALLQGGRYVGQPGCGSARLALDGVGSAQWHPNLGSWLDCTPTVHV